jgi:hypothetical protein
MISSVPSIGVPEGPGIVSCALAEKVVRSETRGISRARMVRDGSSESVQVAGLIRK